MAKFTVILLYPEWMCDGLVETYVWAGEAPNADQAYATAEQAAYYDNDLDPSGDVRFPLIAILKGIVEFAE